MRSRPACYRCLDGHMILWEPATPGVSRLSLQVCSLHWPSRSCWRGRPLSCDDLRLLLRSLNSKITFLSRLPVSIFSPSVLLLLFPHLNNKDIKYAIPACTQTYVVFCFVCFVFVFFFQPKLACMWLLSCSMVSPWKWWSPAAPLRVISSVSSFLPSFQTTTVWHPGLSFPNPFYLIPLVASDKSNFSSIVRKRFRRHCPPAVTAAVTVEWFLLRVPCFFLVFVLSLFLPTL